MAIGVVRYDPAWPGQFQAEAAVLTDLLGQWLAAPVEHIGSTSVPGLAAKPTLDMLAAVHEIDSARGAIPLLQERGYIHAEHRPSTLYFYRPRRGDPDQHTHNLSLTAPGSSMWRERLAFRDAMRASPELADQYQELKQQLAADSLDLMAYTVGKRAFVVAVLAGAGVTAEQWRNALPN